MLWIDAICIDQTNTEERGSQVQLMGEIYNKASQVYVWLGLEDDSSARGVALIQTICAVSKFYQGDKLSYAGLIEVGIPSAEHEDWKALESLFWREWWTRMWIIQEICVSRKGLFICGSVSMDAQDLFEAANFIDHSAIGPTTGIDMGSAIQLSNLRHNYMDGNRSGLLHLLIETRPFQVSNYRDKIYALLGLCSPSEAKMTTPNYKKQYQEVYRSMAVDCLKQGSLELLTAICDPYWRDPYFKSSWVPDWSMGSRATEFLCPSNPISASASNNCCSDVRFSDDGITLLAQGALVDAVAETHKPYLFHSMQERHSRGGELLSVLPDAWIEDRGGETLMRMGTRLLCWEKAALRLKSRHNEDALMAFLRTITAGTIDNLNLKDLYQSFCMVQMFIRPDREMDMTVLKNSFVFGKAFHRASWGRTLFGTRTGRVGIGPYSMRSSDLVVILKGGQTPYILRKKNDHHVLVGECYVHGIMQGEAFGIDVPLETFAIV
jgi:hypothetical protein